MAGARAEPPIELERRAVRRARRRDTLRDDEGPGACSGPFLTSDPVLGRRDVSSAHRKPIEIHGTKVITSVPIKSIDR